MTVVIAQPSNSEIREEVKAMRKASRKLLSSSDGVRKYLIKNGFITKSGKLTKTYSK